MKYFLVVILYFFLVPGTFSQQPAFHKFSLESGLPELVEVFSGYVDDTIYVSFMDGEFFYFDGVKFRKTTYPNSKYFFRDIHSLRNGLFIKDADDKCWYRKKGKSFYEIAVSREYMVFDSVLYKFENEKIYFFREDSKNWDLMRDYPKAIKDKWLKPIVTLIDYTPKPCLQINGSKTFYSFIDNTIFNLDTNYVYVGFANNKPVFYNPMNDDIKWNHCDNILKLNNNIISEISILSDNFKNTNNQSFSFFVVEGNKKHFYTCDTECQLNYCGTLNLAASNVSKIRDDMYFATSFGGVYKINPYVTYFTSENSGLGSNITSIVSHNKAIWVGGYGSGFNRQDGYKFSEVGFDWSNIDEKNILPGGFRKSVNESWFFIEDNPSLIQLKNNKLISFKTILDGNEAQLTGYFIDTLYDGTMALGLYNHGLGIVDSTGVDAVFVHTIEKSKGNKLKNVLTFAQDKKNRIWMGRYSTGVAVYDMKRDTAITFAYKGKKTKSFGLLSMSIDSFDQLWLGTNKGLYYVRDISKFDIFSDNIFKKAIKIILPNNDNSTIMAIKKVKEYIVVGNLTSISFIPAKRYTSGLKNTEIHQLIFGEDLNDQGVQQNGMFYDGDKFLWVAVIDGLFRIDMSHINVDTTGVDINFEKIKNGDTYLNIDDGKIQIDPVKRSLSMSFMSKKNPMFLNNVYYDYVLTNKKNDTISYQYREKKNYLNIDYLNPGEYHLKVNASKNGVVKDKISVKISVPYTIGENPWTRAIGIGILLLALAGFLYYRKEAIKKQSERQLVISKLNNEKEKLKVQAILSSFNPHFINNSLHWVQSRYYQDKDLTKMIGRLSDNISYILNRTKRGLAYHSLKDELNLVRNYITIQKLRFGDSFDYIEQTNGLSIDDINVIVMQIQIHVENAIEHGLRNKSQPGFVKVELKEVNHNYLIIITDDGIGRKKAKLIRSGGTKSGIKMLKDLYSIFNMNSKNNSKIETIFEDEIFSKKGEKYGTKVIIKIPKNFIFEI